MWPNVTIGVWPNEANNPSELLRSSLYRKNKHAGSCHSWNPYHVLSTCITVSWQATWVAAQVTWALPHGNIILREIHMEWMHWSSWLCDAGKMGKEGLNRGQRVSSPGRGPNDKQMGPAKSGTSEHPRHQVCLSSRLPTEVSPLWAEKVSGTPHCHLCPACHLVCKERKPLEGT